MRLERAGRQGATMVIPSNNTPLLAPFAVYYIDKPMMNRLMLLFAPRIPESLLQPSHRPAKRKASDPPPKTQPARKRVRRSEGSRVVGAWDHSAAPIRAEPMRIHHLGLPTSTGGSRYGEDNDEMDVDEDSAAFLRKPGVHISEHMQVDENTQECDVCMVSHQASEFPTPDELPGECSHCTSTCKACIGASLASAVETRPIDEAGCPTCKASWDRYFIELYSTTEVMMRYEVLGMLRVIQAMPNFVWCLSRKCKSGQIHQDGDKAPIVTCVACGFKMCFTHQVAWHPQFTCSQFEARRRAPGMTIATEARLAKEEEKTAAALRRYTKPCPKCGVKTEKAGGCDHMTCKSCFKSRWPSAVLKHQRTKPISCRQTMPA